jgi:hypothetical protein
MHPHSASRSAARAARSPLVPLPAVRLTRAALRLHVYAVVVSIYDEHPGLVTRAYLAGIGQDTDDLVLELCCSGLWSVTECGYLIAPPEVLRIARTVRDQVDE